MRYIHDGLCVRQPMLLSVPSRFSALATQDMKHTWVHLPNLLSRLLQACSREAAQVRWQTSWISTEPGQWRPCTVTVQLTVSRMLLQHNSGWVGFRNTQISMLLSITQKRNVRSKFWWFTRSCNSHYVSHFAAFFIVVGSKTSIAESCNEFDSQQYPYEGHC